MSRIGQAARRNHRRADVRQSATVRRRMRRLAPAVIAICLVMILSATCRFLTTASESAHPVSSGDSSLAPATSSPTFGIDGTATGGSGGNSSATATLTTKYADDLIVIFVVTPPYEPATCSDKSSLSWQNRLMAAFGNADPAVMEDYAIASNPLTSDVIKCTTTYGEDFAILAFGVSGANVTSPFDPSKSLPTVSTGTGAPPAGESVGTVTTTYGTDMIVGLQGATMCLPYGEPYGVTYLIASCANGANNVGPSGALGTLMVNGPGTFNNSWVKPDSDWSLIGDAIRGQTPGECWTDPVGISLSNVAAPVTSSNYNAYDSVTVSFSESTWGASSPYLKTNELEWGLSSSYTGYESGATSGTQTSFTITYLNPGSKFYFEIIAEPSNSCEYSAGSYASSFSTPSLSVANELMGYVLTPGGSPISGATISGVIGPLAGFDCPSAGCYPTTTTTSAGFYTLQYKWTCEDPSTGQTSACYVEYWQAAAPNYFYEIWYGWQDTAPNAGNPGAYEWQTFYLNPDPTTSQDTLIANGGQDGVYTVLAFVHTTNVACQVSQGLSVSTSVYAYLAGSGFTDTSTYTTSSTFPATTPLTDQGENVGVAYEAQESGYYVINPSGGISFGGAYAVGSLEGPYNEFYSGSDPVTSPPPIGSTSTGFAGPYGEPAKSQGLYEMQSSGDLQVQIGLQESIGISVGDFVQFSVSWDLSFGIQSTQTSFYGVNCYMGSLQASSYQYFEVYAQTGSPGTSESLGMTVSIWQCQAAPTTTQACVPIDQPT